VKITEIGQIIGLLFPGQSCILIFTLNGLGFILGDFSTNASGHYAWRLEWHRSLLIAFPETQISTTVNKKVVFASVFYSIKLQLKFKAVKQLLCEAYIKYTASASKTNGKVNSS
jgi:hypothetical protein